MTWTFDGTAPTFDSSSGATFDGATSGGSVSPTVTLNPSSQTVGSGSAATFTAAASGSPTPTVQWQTDSGTGGVTWSNISGATSTTYTTGALTTASSGYEYRAVFTNTSGSATSSAATVTVLTSIVTGGRMQLIFGAGALIVTPLTDYTGTAITPSTPRRIGVFQEATFDSSAENKMAYGSNQYPYAVARGKGKIDLKIKALQISIDQYGALFAGQPANVTTGTVSAVMDNTGSTIPASPYQVTPTVPGSGTWVTDLGVDDGAGRNYTCVTGTPTTGQYAVSAGVYTFAAADTGKKVFISYTYSATSTTAKSLIVQNVPMGSAPILRLDLLFSYSAGNILLTLFEAIAAKASFGTKIDDFAPIDFEFDGFVNSSGQAYQISGAQ